MKNGILKLKKGAYQEAIVELKQALNYKLDDIMGWLVLSNCYYQLEEYDKMLECSRNIIKYNSKIKEPRDIFYSLPSTIENLETLKKKFALAIKNPEEYKGEWGEVGGFYQHEKEYEKALFAFEKAVKEHPHNPIFQMNIASAFLESEQYDKALESINLLVESFPYLLHGLVLKAKILIKKRELDQALSICEFILKEDPLMEPAVKLKAELQKMKGLPSIEDDNPLEIYENVEVRKNQKEFLVELEKLNHKPIKVLAYAKMELSVQSGFVVRAGYVVELNLTFIQNVPASIRNLKHLKALLMPHRMDRGGIPEGIEELQELEYFMYQNMGIGVAPLSRGVEPKYNPFTDVVCKLKNLRVLNIRDTYDITHLPECLATLPHLEEINIGNCHVLTNVPDLIKVHFKPTGDNFRLKLLRRPPNHKNPEDGWEGSKFSKIPTKVEERGLIGEEGEMKIYDDTSIHPKELIFLNQLIEEMASLQQIYRLRKMYSEIKPKQIKDNLRNFGLKYVVQDGFIRELTIAGSRNFKKLPNTIRNLTLLEKLTIGPGARIQTLPETFGTLKNLKELWIQSIEEVPSSINQLKNLEVLTLNCTKPPPNLTELRKLYKFILISREFGEIKGLDTLESLQHLEIYNADAIFVSKLAQIPKLKQLKITEFYGNHLPDEIGLHQFLTGLTLRKCYKLETLPKGLENLHNLKSLIIEYSPQLAHFPLATKSFPFLETLSLKGCKFEMLPLGMKLLENLNIIEVYNNPINPNRILEEREKGEIDDEEAIYQFGYLIKGWKQSHHFEYYGQEDFEQKVDTVKQDSILGLIKIIQLKNFKKELLEEVIRILTEALQDSDPIFRFFVAKKLLEHFPSVSASALQSLIKTENSHLNLKNIYYILKSESKHEDNMKLLLSRLSRAYNVVPIEAGALFELFSQLIILDHVKAFDDRAYSTLGFNSLKENELGQAYTFEDDHVVSLTLRGIGLKIIPEPIQVFKNLESLDLQDNSIQKIPKWIGDISRLRNLNLRKNEISSISPLILDKKPNLSIKLMQNPISKVLESQYSSFLSFYLEEGILKNDAIALSKISYIIGSKLSAYSIEEEALVQKEANYFVVNGEGRVRSLVLNSITHIKLRDLPNSIFSLDKLEFLEISNTYSLNKISSEITSLKNLKILYLKYNDFQLIPQEVLKLSSLEELNISGNKIQEIPSSIKNLTRLKFLDLSNNILMKIPESLFDMLSLNNLLLMGNNIKEVPPLIGNLENLKELNLAFNELKAIPKEITFLKSLEVLSLANNTLTSLPPNMEVISNLKVLNISQNKISELPSSICNMKFLEDLDVSENQLEFVQDCIANIPRLRRFNLSYNLMDAPSPVLHSIKGIIFNRKRNPEYDYIF